MLTPLRLFIVVIVISSILLSGCSDSHIETSQAVTVGDQTLGSSSRIITISSERYYLVEKDKDITPKLLNIVNGGKYNIAKVQTNYTDGYLTSAEIYYNTQPPTTAGNQLRVLVLHSDKYYLQEKDQEIRPKFDKTMNSGLLDIVDVVTVYKSGYLLAAEIYYREKE